MVSGQVLLHEKNVRNMSHHDNFVRIPRVVCWSAVPHHALPFCLNMCWQQYCTIDVHTNTHTACTALKINFLKLPTKTHKNPLTVIDSPARYCLRMAQSDRGDQ